MKGVEEFICVWMVWIVLLMGMLFDVFFEEKIFKWGIDWLFWFV